MKYNPLQANYTQLYDRASSGVRKVINQGIDLIFGGVGNLNNLVDDLMLQGPQFAYGYASPSYRPDTVRPDYGVTYTLMAKSYSREQREEAQKRGKKVNVDRSRMPDTYTQGKPMSDGDLARLLREVESVEPRVTKKEERKRRAEGRNTNRGNYY